MSSEAVENIFCSIIQKRKYILQALFLQITRKPIYVTNFGKFILINLYLHFAA